MKLAVGVMVAALAMGANVHDPLDRETLERSGAVLEWVLGARFTPAERSRLQELQIEEWNRTSAQQHQSTRDLAALKGKLEAMTADQQNRVHTQLQDMLLKSLRQQPEAEVSRLLLDAYNRGGQASTAPAATPAPDGNYPRVLAGRWSSVSTSNVQYTNQATGSWAPPSGEGTSWEIFPDGRWRSDSLIQSSLYNCTMTILAGESGRYRVNNGTITFDSVGGEMDSKDNCSRNGNYKKPLPARQYVYQWRVERDQWGEKLCLASPGGKPSCFYRK